ncbi:MAG: hypothetical protein N4A49_12250 [Marinifilaceae bacterium]|jgi:predicted transposase YbfD/YdcC|nr:hypothetical protein [Marinifilaceae bacterium]
MGCQTEIAKDIDFLDDTYMLIAKENQKELYENIKDRFLECDDKIEDFDFGHSRIETRKASVITDF